MKENVFLTVFDDEELALELSKCFTLITKEEARDRFGQVEIFGVDSEGHEGLLDDIEELNENWTCFVLEGTDLKEVA